MTTKTCSWCDSTCVWPRPKRRNIGVVVDCMNDFHHPQAGEERPMKQRPTNPRFTQHQLDWIASDAAYHAGQTKGPARTRWSAIARKARRALEALAKD